MSRSIAAAVATACPMVVMSPCRAERSSAIVFSGSGAAELRSALRMHRANQDADPPAGTKTRHGNEAARAAVNLTAHSFHRPTKKPPRGSFSIK
ncbi:MAG: hypothetical protein E6Q50_12695 [Lysobacter sp.]|nr:MAG: hypothetical protein E6Q50_12695 [Lysobacter sp.]